MKNSQISVESKNIRLALLYFEIALIFEHSFEYKRTFIDIPYCLFFQLSDLNKGSLHLQKVFRFISMTNQGI